jgi:hypothetical protein
MADSLVDKCLNIMGCDPNCATREDEAVLMREVIDLILGKATNAVRGVRYDRS